ncbi:archaemetzincin family Zn-dependent metalloprotease [Candidatus Neomarinimicrobiota bacterium]
MAAIYCVPLDGFPEGAIRSVAPEISDAFRRPVKFLPGQQMQPGVYDPSRGQFNSTTILQMLQTFLPSENDQILGFTSADLFIPIFTFVFGEAQLNGPAAVVSGARLQNEFYGLPTNAAVYQERLLKECIHELGHTVGLRHCLTNGCVMRKSTYVENIDLKSAEFCPACRAYID